MTAALLVGSAVNFGFLWAERSRAGLIEATGPGLTRFVDLAAEIQTSPPPQLERPVPISRPTAGGRFTFSPTSMVANRRLTRNVRMEQRLQKALEDGGIKVKTVNASVRTTERGVRGNGPGFGGPGFGGQGFGGQGFGGQGFGQGGPRGQGLRLAENGRLAPTSAPPASPDAPPRPQDVVASPASPNLQPGQQSGQQPGQQSGGQPPAIGAGRPSNGFGNPGGLGGPRIGGTPPAGAGGPQQVREVVFSAQFPDGRWLNASFFTPLPPQDEIWRLGASTFVAFACVLIAALWIASRLSRPLNDLTEAAAHVGAANEPQEVMIRGPSDVRQTLEAFNAMSQRVSQLLGEKDVMLGALGHDLRTPLASLRIRLETMEPEAERAKAIKTIEETTKLLEAILDLARQGRSSEPVQTMDLAVLIDDIVEDYVETSAPVALAKSEKAPAAVRPLLFKRMMRNLIDNAVAYGGAARVSVVRCSGQIEVRIEDDGPGMSEDALATATRPFVRGDASRNRSTGGAGLGLALADAIAKTHKGVLLLANRKPHGLMAVVKLPLAATPFQTASFAVNPLTASAPGPSSQDKAKGS